MRDLSEESKMRSDIENLRLHVEDCRAKMVSLNDRMNRLVGARLYAIGLYEECYGEFRETMKSNGNSGGDIGSTPEEVPELDKAAEEAEGEEEIPEAVLGGHSDGGQ